MKKRLSSGTARVIRIMSLVLPVLLCVGVTIAMVRGKNSPPLFVYIIFLSMAAIVYREYFLKVFGNLVELYQNGSKIVIEKKDGLIERSVNDVHQITSLTFLHLISFKSGEQYYFYPTNNPEGRALLDDLRRQE